MDFGYSKTTIVLENNSEILGFNIINFGIEVLEEEFKRKESLNYFDIENIIKETDANYSKYEEIFSSFFNLIFDAIAVASQDIEKALFIKNIFISG
ncbi:TPA: hypothetical protein DEG21_02245 [Patescibacteria group bacterium]|nr:hypothetical protein [Candidatus Gracilibacteria bacterium]